MGEKRRKKKTKKPHYSLCEESAASRTSKRAAAGAGGGCMMRRRRLSLGLRPLTGREERGGLVAEEGAPLLLEAARLLPSPAGESLVLLRANQGRKFAGFGAPAETHLVLPAPENWLAAERSGEDGGQRKREAGPGGTWKEEHSDPSTAVPSGAESL